ncbi:MAG: hypothetical protein ABIQ30_11575 [Devosia sp.]
MKLSDRQIAIIVAVLTFVSLVFYTPQFSNSQVVTRMGLALAIVELGSLSIDRVAEQTVDKALVDGHYYADKAPGLSLLAVPPVFVVKTLRDLAGIKQDSSEASVFIMYAQIGTLTVVGLPAAIAAALVFLMALRLGASRQGALFGSLAIAIGSPFFFWSTTFFSHSLVGSLLVFMLALAIERERWDWWHGVFIGLLAGTMVVVDFVGGLVAAIAGIVLVIAMWRPTIAAHLRFAAGVVAAAVLGVLPLLIYNKLAFGSPFQLGYMSVVGFEGMKTGFFGIGMPNPAIVWELLFGVYRGLLPYVPVLLLVPYGLWAMGRRPGNLPIAVAVFAVSLALILINAGYYYWHGGWSAGPRHIVPMLPLLGLALAFAWPGSLWQRALALLLLAWGLMMAALVSSTWMFADEDKLFPLKSIYFAQAMDPKTWFNMSLMLPGWIAFALLYRITRTKTERGA